MATTTQGNPFPTSDVPLGGGVSDNGMRTTSSSGGMGSTSSTSDTIGRIKQGAHDAVDRIADKAAPAVERMRGSVGSMSDTMHAKGEEFGAMQEQWMESCRATVREHPLATVAVAVAAGMVLSKLFSSR